MAVSFLAQSRFGGILTAPLPMRRSAFAGIDIALRFFRRDANPLEKLGFWRASSRSRPERRLAKSLWLSFRSENRGFESPPGVPLSRLFEVGNLHGSAISGDRRRQFGHADR